MANMSYCRFENTSRDLYDCVNALADLDSLNLDDLKEELGRREFDKAQGMYDFCQDYIATWEQIEEND
jgi:hypothetical protein